jgi:hypothetical protein
MRIGSTTLLVANSRPIGLTCGEPSRKLIRSLLLLAARIEVTYKHSQKEVYGA